MRITTSTALAAVLSTMFVAGAAVAQDMMEPLADGFPNRPIVLIVIDDAGSADSVFASAIADAASQISPQPIIVQHRDDFNNFGTWEGIAWIKDQGELASEGYITYVLTLPDAMVDRAAMDIEEMTGQTVDDLNPIIATERVPYFLIQRADAPWGNTIEEFVAHAKANPDSIRHITGGPGGGQDAALRFWADNLGITVRDIIGGNPSERALAVASGEGDITASPPDVLRPHYDAERVTILMGAGSNPFPAPWEDVPPSNTLFDTLDPFSQTRVIAASPDVSDEHREWLYELFSAAAKSEGHVEQRSRVTALELIDLGPEETKELSNYGLDTSVSLFRELGIYWGDM